MENQSMFEQANQNTLEIMKKLVIFEDNMTEQLNFLAKQALISAKTEVVFAQIENIPFERLSTLAQQVYKNPDFILEKKFELTNLINAPAKEQDIFEEFSNKVVAVPIKTKDSNTEIFISKEAEQDIDAFKNDDEIFIAENFSSKNEEVEATKTAPTKTITPQTPKKHSNKRREWVACVSMMIDDECELRIEAARLTELDQKRAAKAKAEQSKKDAEVEYYYYNLS